MEFALVRTSIEPVFMESSEDFFDMLSVFLGVIGVNEDIVEVDNHRDV